MVNGHCHTAARNGCSGRHCLEPILVGRGKLRAMTGKRGQGARRPHGWPCNDEQRSTRLSGVHGRPRFAKHSIRDNIEVKIARVHSDFVCNDLSRSLMECAGWCPIALSHFACQPDNGLHQPRSYLLCHHFMIACAIGESTTCTALTCSAGSITRQRNRTGNYGRVPTAPTRSVRSCLPVPPLLRFCCACRSVGIANSLH